MPKIDLLDTDGKKIAQIELPKEIFAAKINPPLMAQAVRVYLSNQRSARARAKTRGQVVGSGRKIYRQKGTGRARHGDRQAPIFVGGGKAHGPTGRQNYKLQLSKKMKKLALFSALSSKLKDEDILVVKGLEKVEPKTKAMVKILNNLKLDQVKKALIILPSPEVNVIRSAGNIDGVETAQAKNLNVYEVLRANKLVLLEKSVEVISNNFISKRGA